jgi:hypothetical protein
MGPTNRAVLCSYGLKQPLWVRWGSPILMLCILLTAIALAVVVEQCHLGTNLNGANAATAVVAAGAFLFGYLQWLST